MMCWSLALDLLNAMHPCPGARCVGALSPKGCRRTRHIFGGGTLRTLGAHCKRRGRLRGSPTRM